MTPQHKRVSIIGGSGFVGQHLAYYLARDGWAVRILMRKRKDLPDIRVLPGSDIVVVDVYNTQQLRQAITGSDAVINLVGILNERGDNGRGFYDAHVTLTDRVIDSCVQAGVKRYLHMSALHADAAHGPSHYLRTKGMAEARAHDAAARGLQVSSFRPSVIFGEHDSFFNRFAALLKLMPGVFPLACAEARFAPVFVGDVANAFVQALRDSASIGKRIDLCGPKIYTLRQLVDYTARCIGRQMHIMGLNQKLSLWQARVFEFVPGKPFSLDNFRSTSIDSVCNDDAPLAKYQCHTAVEAIVPYYLGKS